MKESTKNYYDEKANHIHEMFLEKVQDNIQSFEAFTNIPFAKSMIRVKFEYDLEYKTIKGDESIITEDDIIDMTIDDGLESLIYSAITKMKINKNRDIYLTHHLPQTSSDQIKDFLDFVSNIKFGDKITQQLDSIKYLYFGEKHITFMPWILGKDIVIEDGYVGKYKDIKFFYISEINDIYMSNSAFVDLNTINIKYNEYILEEFDGIFTDEGYETIPNNMKRGVMTLNCFLGDPKLLRLNCEFGNGMGFTRKLKLMRILKNEIDI